jgi:hypothetical protein
MIVIGVKLSNFFIIVTFLVFYTNCTQGMEEIQKSCALLEVSGSASSMQAEIRPPSFLLPFKETEKYFPILQQEPFNHMPYELTIRISDYLSGENKDFQNFSLSCKKIMSILIKNENLFVPEDKKLLIELIKTTPLIEMRSFFFKFSRNLTKEKLDYFSRLSLNFSNHAITPVLTEIEAKEKLENLKIYIKMNTILFFANYNKSQDKLVSIKDDKLCSLFTDLSKYHSASLKVPAQYIARQALLVKYGIKAYLLHPDRQQMFADMQIDVENDIIQLEESQQDWIPLVGYYDDQF